MDRISDSDSEDAGSIPAGATRPGKFRYTAFHLAMRTVFRKLCLCDRSQQAHAVFLSTPPEILSRLSLCKKVTGTLRGPYRDLIGTLPGPYRDHNPYTTKIKPIVNPDTTLSIDIARFHRNGAIPVYPHSKAFLSRLRCISYFVTLLKLRFCNYI